MIATLAIVLAATLLSAEARPAFKVDPVPKVSEAARAVVLEQTQAGTPARAAPRCPALPFLTKGLAVGPIRPAAETGGSGPDARAMAHGRANLKD